MVQYNSLHIVHFLSVIVGCWIIHFPISRLALRRIKMLIGNGNLICPLTDKDGNAQGTVYFRPASSNGNIAEVSASADTRLLYFRKITFMHNSVWPLNSPESRWHKFDIVHNLDISIKDHLEDEDKSLNWVCVRESGNGVPPVFCTVTNGIYGNLDKYGDEDIDFYRIRTTWFCPGMSGAQNIGKMLQPDWELFRAVFQEATGKVIKIIKNLLKQK